MFEKNMFKRTVSFPIRVKKRAYKGLVFTHWEWVDDDYIRILFNEASSGIYPIEMVEVKIGREWHLFSAKTGEIKKYLKE